MDSNKVYNKFKESISRVKSNNLTSVVDLYTYVLTPLVATLGYDLLDFSGINLMPEKGIIQAKVLDNFNTVFSLRTSNFSTDDNDRVAVILDLKANNIVVLFKTLNRWRMVNSINLLGDEQEQIEGFKFISMYAGYKSLTMYFKHTDNIDKFLSDGVLLYELSNNNLNNIFVSSVLYNELNNPSEELIMLIAKGLSENYYLDDYKELGKRLKQLSKEKGLNGLLGLQVINDSRNDKYNIELPDITTDKSVKSDTNSIEDTFVTKENINDLGNEDNLDTSNDSDDTVAIDSLDDLF